MGLKNDRVTNHNTITMKIKRVLALHIYFFSIRQDSLIDDIHTHTNTASSARIWSERTRRCRTARPADVPLRWEMPPETAIYAPYFENFRKARFHQTHRFFPRH